jgi:hypothetical protein
MSRQKAKARVIALDATWKKKRETRKSKVSPVLSKAKLPAASYDFSILITTTFTIGVEAAAPALSSLLLLLLSLPPTDKSCLLS